MSKSDGIEGYSTADGVRRSTQLFGMDKTVIKLNGWHILLLAIITYFFYKYSN